MCVNQIVPTTGLKLFEIDVSRETIEAARGNLPCARSRHLARQDDNIHVKVGHSWCVRSVNKYVPTGYQSYHIFGVVLGGLQLRMDPGRFECFTSCHHSREPTYPKIHILSDALGRFPPSHDECQSPPGSYFHCLTSFLFSHICGTLWIIVDVHNAHIII